ncbi:hypothetical protein AU255_08830 [Methyloprofundus sedimenti]|uniref:Uncharacterized protein n=1 Tax=Methyloprofundus sedimenti TaxID=1420851 RepID=A0A1V8M8S3_9GAMM|nr:hypothetical protein AU255_08830 [Methyloprofundus sedimenti]
MGGMQKIDIFLSTKSGNAMLELLKITCTEGSVRAKYFLIRLSPLPDWHIEFGRKFISESIILK